MRALLARLGDPQLCLRGVLVGGTNGKGSTVAMVAAILAAAGYSTAQSPSPHLHSYRERITIDGRPIARDDLLSLLDEVLSASEPGTSEHGPATEFELLTAAAYLWAARRSVDVMVMEVGLGGRLDASNTWDADVAAITGVGLDHQEYLGADVASIAKEKAAIIKPGCLAITGADGIALAVISAHAAGIGVPLQRVRPLPLLAQDRRGLSLEHVRLGRLQLPLLGRHQAANAAVALGIVDALGSAAVATVPDSAIRSGLAATHWPGRLELIEHRGCTVLLDGAHNPDGAAALAATVDEIAPSLPGGRATLVLGVMADKAVSELLRGLAASELLRTAHLIATAVPDTPRALPPADLAHAWSSVTGATADATADAATALAEALDLAALRNGPLVIAGSLYLVGHLRARLVSGTIDDDA